MTLSEITERNEEFLDKIIAESTANQGDEKVAETPGETKDIPEGDSTDPAVGELSIILSYGEVMNMGFTSSVFNELMASFDNIKEMVNLMHQQLVAVFKGEHIPEIEASVTSALEDLGVPVEKYNEAGDRKVIFMLTDVLCIYSEITHMLTEKKFMEETFRMFIGGGEENDNQEAVSEDN